MAALTTHFILTRVENTNFNSSLHIQRYIDLYSLTGIILLEMIIINYFEASKCVNFTFVFGNYICIKLIFLLGGDVIFKLNRNVNLISPFS